LEKTKYIFMCRHHHSAGQNHNIRTAKKSFENVIQFKYIGATVKVKVQIRITFWKELRKY